MIRPVLAGILLAGLFAAQASAHAQLVKADPRVGSTVRTPPVRLRLEFDQPVQIDRSAVELVEPGGLRTDLDRLVRDPKDAKTIIATLPPNLTSGRYAVRWRVLSTDGHRTQGDFRFWIR